MTLLKWVGYAGLYFVIGFVAMALTGAVLEFAGAGLRWLIGWLRVPIAPLMWCLVIPVCLLLGFLIFEGLRGNLS